MLFSNSAEGQILLPGSPTVYRRRRIKGGSFLLIWLGLLTLCALRTPLLSIIRTINIPNPVALETIIKTEQRNATWEARAEEVKQSFQKAYLRYQMFAFSHDELRPISNESVNNLNGWGLTTIDSIDTMILMNLTDEYEQARNHVAKVNFKYTYTGSIPFFETVIRYVGGLLSAYHLSEDKVFLTAAETISAELLPVFGTTSGLPGYSVNLVGENKIGGGWNPGNTMLAEMASCQLEYKYLAHLTGKKAYFAKVEHVIKHLNEYQKSSPLWPIWWDEETGRPGNPEFSVGAMADSAYEYLLKGYLMSGNTETHLLDMYLASMRAIISRLVFLSRSRHLMYVTDVIGNQPKGNMQHLSCFFPGLLALGNHLLPDDVYEPGDKETFQWVAEGLAHTCWVLYADQRTGLGPEEVQFHPYNEDYDYESGRWIRHYERWKLEGRPSGRPPGLHGSGPLPGSNSVRKDYNYNNPAWLLRPEAIESMYLMWKTTGDVVWRERAWQMFKAIERSARLPNDAYAPRQHVDMDILGHSDEQPSYFFAETLKYLYLTFLEHDPWPLDKFVFNTEAHPLPIFNWKATEKSWFGIP
ncbi:seven-hairpin glycosidase [Serendipita vermifera]|nr:seven-hairpin glycosidase [Serendipita vermifera]